MVSGHHISPFYHYRFAGDAGSGDRRRHPKAAKFVDMILPVAGKILSDAADTIIGCTLMIKCRRRSDDRHIGNMCPAADKNNRAGRSFQGGSGIARAISDSHHQLINDIAVDDPHICVVSIRGIHVHVSVTAYSAGNISAMLR